jgi:CheY-like chemotaxis protein
MHQLTVTLPARPVWLEADPVRLAQVVTNLINNASKYTPEEGHLRLTVDRIDDQVVLRIQDNGMGIAPDMLPRVFDLFAQADCTLDRADGGLGIGLTLVKSLVELHGGQVEALSDGHGKGSEFVIRLPIGRAEAERPVDRTTPTHAATPARRILAVDDNVDSVESLARLLGLQGHEVRTAYDGPTALATAEAFQPQVVLLDIGLPRMDGYEVARRLRKKTGLKDILLVAVTGYGQDDDRRRATEAGFDGHLVKPADLGVLQALLTTTANPRA